MRNRKKYPRGWSKITREAREQAGNCCQKCGVAHGTKRVSPWTGREWPVWLQCAHINHDPENPNPVLAVVCPRCHWRHYRKPGQRAAWVALEREKHRRLIAQAWCQ